MFSFIYEFRMFTNVCIHSKQLGLQSKYAFYQCMHFPGNWAKENTRPLKNITHWLNYSSTDTFRVYVMTHVGIHVPLFYYILKAWPSLMLPYASEMLKTEQNDTTGGSGSIFSLLISISVPLCNRIFTAIMPMVAAGLISDDPTLQPIRRLISLVRPFGGSPLCSLLF